jgi:hypothetical protein
MAMVFYQHPLLQKSLNEAFIVRRYHYFIYYTRGISRGLAADKQEGVPEKPKALQVGGAATSPAAPKLTSAEIPRLCLFPLPLWGRGSAFGAPGNHAPPGRAGGG